MLALALALAALGCLIAAISPKWEEGPDEKH